MLNHEKNDSIRDTNRQLRRRNKQRRHGATTHCVAPLTAMANAGPNLYVWGGKAESGHFGTYGQFSLLSQGNFEFPGRGLECGCTDTIVPGQGVKTKSSRRHHRIQWAVGATMDKMHIRRRRLARARWVRGKPETAGGDLSGRRSARNFR